MRSEDSYYEKGTSKTMYYILLTTTLILMLCLLRAENKKLLSQLPAAQRGKDEFFMDKDRLLKEWEIMGKQEERFAIQQKIVDGLLARLAEESLWKNSWPETERGRDWAWGRELEGEMAREKESIWLEERTRRLIGSTESLCHDFEKVKGKPKDICSHGKGTGGRLWRNTTDFEKEHHLRETNERNRTSGRTSQPRPQSSKSKSKILKSGNPLADLR